MGDALVTTADGKVLKANEHKPRLSLLDGWILGELARVYEYGAGKYHEGSWKKFTPDSAREVLLDAAIRHTFDYLSGEYYDTDSGLPHLMHAAWNLMTLHYYLGGGHHD